MKKLIFVLSACLLLISHKSRAQDQTLNAKQDEMLAELLSLQAEMIKNNKIGNRYKIQIGSFASIKKAEELKDKFEKKNPNFPVQLLYESPNYKVWVGDFTSRLAADRVFLKIKKDYRSAFVFKPNS